MVDRVVIVGDDFQMPPVVLENFDLSKVLKGVLRPERVGLTIDGTLVTRQDGVLTPVTFAVDATANAVVRRDAAGRIRAAAPNAASDVVTLGYFRDNTPSFTPPVASVNKKTGDVVLAKADVGLGNVDNTADSAKPVSTEQRNAIDAAKTTDASKLTDGLLAPARVGITADYQIPVRVGTGLQGVRLDIVGNATEAIAYKDDRGGVRVPAPQREDHAASKAYADALSPFREWDATAKTWPALNSPDRPVMFVSTNDPTAAAPTAMRQNRDMWIRHPDAPAL